MLEKAMHSIKTCTLFAYSHATFDFGCHNCICVCMASSYLPVSGRAERVVSPIRVVVAAYGGVSYRRVVNAGVASAAASQRRGDHVSVGWRVGRAAQWRLHYLCTANDAQHDIPFCAY